MVGRAGGADDHRPEEIDSPFVDTHEDRLRQVLVEDFPLLHDLLVDLTSSVGEAIAVVLFGYVRVEVVVVRVVGDDVEPFQVLDLAVLQQWCDGLSHDSVFREFPYLRRLTTEAMVAVWWFY